MARACVEDTCTVIAGNGVGNPNALKLDVPLDPAGGIVCTPGVGLGVNIAIAPDLEAGLFCNNILHKDPSGAFYVDYPGVESHPVIPIATSEVPGFPSYHYVNIYTGATPSPGYVNLATSINAINPFVGCGAIALCTVVITEIFSLDAINTAFWIQPSYELVALGSFPGYVGDVGFGPSKSVITRYDAHGWNGEGNFAEHRIQHEMTLAVSVIPGGDVTFEVHATKLKRPDDISANVNGTIDPFAFAAGEFLFMKDGVVA